MLTAASEVSYTKTEMSASPNIAANLSGRIKVRFYWVLTGPRMTETGRKADLVGYHERTAAFPIIDPKAGRQDCPTRLLLAQWWYVAFRDSDDWASTSGVSHNGQFR